VKDLFGNETVGQVIKVPGARKAEHMHRQLIAAYGIQEGEKCKNCICLKRFGRGKKVWSKCERATLDGHLATDWRAGWQACGKFETENKKP
jgi:hypothetical protein